MNIPRVSIIAAVGKNRELGKNNELIWRISDDLKRVKRLTVGHPIIMGRKTYESIGKPLPDRTNMIVTSQDVCIDGCLVFNSFKKALDAAKAIEQEEIFIFGGASIYKEAMPHTDRLYLTVIEASDPKADVFFPDYSDFIKIIKEDTRDQEGIAYQWLTLER